jgi:hypothetical protein
LKVDINDILRDDFQDIIVTKELKRIHGQKGLCDVKSRWV